MTTKKQPEQQADVPSQLLDTYGNPGLVAAGGLIESAWGNAVVNRSILTFPSKAAMDAVTPAAGRFAVTGDSNVIWLGDGSRWRATAFGNVMAFVTNGGGASGQPLPSGAVTQATWATENDPNGIVTSGSFTVPAGWAGRWRFEWAVSFNGTSPGSRQAWLYAGTSVYGHQGTEGPVQSPVPRYLAASASVVMSEGQGALIQIYQDSAATLSCNTQADQYFSGTYVGPY